MRSRGAALLLLACGAASYPLSHVETWLRDAAQRYPAPQSGAGGFGAEIAALEGDVLEASGVAPGTHLNSSTLRLYRYTHTQRHTHVTNRSKAGGVFTQSYSLVGAGAAAAAAAEARARMA